MMTNLITKISPVIVKIGSLEIRWYAILILVGALLVYFASQWAMKFEKYPKEILENEFFVALPAGLIGARLWWCIADAGSPWKSGDILGFFRVWEGGLAIQGGVILGVAVGIIYLRWKYKKANVLFVMDAVIPNILIAQVLGRWGNFMNQEVYGACVDASKVNYLPGFIKDQMAAGNGGYGEFVGNGIKCASGEIAQPLFLYEGIINLIGFILISFVLRKFWTKGRVKGDLAALYFIWYGICRACLEPLRNSEFIMDGIGGIPVSVVTSIIFIVLGVALMIVLRVINHKKNKANKEEVSSD